MLKFILLSTQRSGSSFLGTSLSSHPDVKCFEEVFMPKNTSDVAYRAYRSASLHRQIQNLVQRKKLIYEFLEQLLASESSTHAVGFKFMYRQARRHHEVKDWCSDHNVRVIHLIRQNFLKLMVSGILARQRGVYHSKKALPPTKVRIATSRLVRDLDRMAHRVRQNRDIFSEGQYMEVLYEDFVARQDDETRRILKFLEINDFTPLTSDLVKISPNTLEDLIDNFQAVVETLAGTPYEAFLHD